MSILLPILLGIGVSIGVAVLVELTMRLLERTAPELNAIQVEESVDSDQSVS